MILLEDIHPALLNALERMIRQENTVPSTTVKDFDGTLLHIHIARPDAPTEEATNAVADPGSPTVVDPDAEAATQRNVTITITLQHTVSRKVLDQFQNLAAVVGPKFPKGTQIEFAPAANSAHTVAVCIPPGTSDAARLEIAQCCAQLRVWVVCPIFFRQFDLFLGGSKVAVVQPLRIPYHPGESMYLYTGRGGADFLCLISMVVEGKDAQVFARNFLQTFQDAKRLQKELAGGPGFVYAYQQAPTDVPAGLIVDAETDQTFWVQFQLQRSHMEGSDAARTKVVANLMNFRNYLLYHIHCCRSYMHGLMRQRVEKSLQVLNQSKTSTTGRSRVVIK